MAEKGEEFGDDAATDLISTKRGCCCCFWIPCFSTSRSTETVGSGPSWWKREWADGKEDGGRGWGWKGWDALRKAKEWSEMVAGPKWKTFLRRFNRRGGRHGKYQYDPLSYSLNFDEGHGQNGNLEGEEYGYCDFSTRYAAKPSVGGMGKDGQDLGMGAGQ